MEHRIIISTVAARPTAVIAAETTWPEYPQVWRRLLDAVHANIVWGGTGHKGRNVMLYLDDVPHVEVGVEIDQPVEIGGPIIRSALPAGNVAMTVHQGSYDGLGRAHEAVIKWCSSQGLHRTGPRWEVYGHHHDDPAQVITEIYYLLG